MKFFLIFVMKLFDVHFLRFLFLNIFFAIKYAKDIRRFTFQYSSNYNLFFSHRYNEIQKRDDKELQIVSN